MKLSPLHEALIFIEDKVVVQLSDLQFMDKPVLRGILGKMEAMKLIKKTEPGIFKISVAGQNLLNKYLDNLHKGTLHWSGKWTIASFSIPESNRPLRDKFRRTIESKGMRMILGGLWITPLELKNEIADYAKEIGIFSNVFICETNEITTGVTQEDLLSLWGFVKSKQEIYDFIEEADSFLKQKEKTPFAVKKMIFKYALILDRQPKVPIELFPADWPQFRANIVYKKIRRTLNP